MGATPCTDGITIEFGCQIRVELKDGSLESILKAFCKILPEILRDFIQKIVVGFGECDGAITEAILLRRMWE